MLKQHLNKWDKKIRQVSCQLKVDFMQIIAIKPEYEWEIQNIRTQKMRLKNSKVIDEAVQEEKEN